MREKRIFQKEGTKCDKTLRQEICHILGDGRNNDRRAVNLRERGTVLRLRRFLEAFGRSEQGYSLRGRPSWL